MHFDFTIHFWTVLSQLSALGVLVRFLTYCAKQLGTIAKAAKMILEQHHEVYGWYKKVDGKPWPWSA